MKIRAIILSGGSGRRLGSPLPKQYIELSGKPILSFSLRAFQESCTDEIIIAAAPAYMELCRKIIKDSGISKAVDVIEGGNERYDSVMKGLAYYRQKCSSCADTLSRRDDSIVLIHDGARPFISVNTIHEVVSQVQKHRAAIAAVPCTDTIKIIDEDGMIVSTTERRNTWAAQTPQGFYLDDIYYAYSAVLSGTCAPAKAGEEGNGTHSASGGQSGADPAVLSKITDDAMVYQAAFPGRGVKTVLSDSSNIKITSAMDLDIARSIMDHCI